jgi:glycosyltransferase involved in cell wall biosynthesis
VDVSVIIPAYNEGKNITNVLSVIHDMTELTDILVVNDGSTDNTSSIAHSFGVRVIELAENMGKGHAMYTGLQNTNSSAVLFLDADLLGLKQNHVLELINPICDGSADMTLGIFASGRGVTDLAQRLTPFLTGQRAVKRNILEELSRDEWISGYGIEVVLTRYAREKGFRVLEIPLDNVTHTMKEEKMGLAKGVKARLKMYWEIAKEVNKV